MGRGFLALLPTPPVLVDGAVIGPPAVAGAIRGPGSARVNPRTTPSDDGSVLEKLEKGGISSCQNHAPPFSGCNVPCTLFRGPRRRPRRRSESPRYRRMEDHHDRHGPRMSDQLHSRRAGDQVGMPRDRRGKLTYAVGPSQSRERMPYYECPICGGGYVIDPAPVHPKCDRDGGALKRTSDSAYDRAQREDSAELPSTKKPHRKSTKSR